MVHFPLEDTQIRHLAQLSLSDYHHFDCSVAAVADCIIHLLLPRKFKKTYLYVCAYFGQIYINVL